MPAPSRNSIPGSSLLDDEHPVVAHHDEDVGELPVAAEPLLTVDDPLVAVAFGVRHERAGVGATLRLRHRVARPHLLREQRLEVLLLLLLGAVGGEDLHVPGVGCLAAEDRRRRAVRAEDLVQERELELPEAGAADVLVEEDAPEALLLDLVLQPVDEAVDGRRTADRPTGGGERERQRLDLLAAELLDPVELLLEFEIGREVPGHEVPPRVCGALRVLANGSSAVQEA